MKYRHCTWKRGFRMIPDSVRESLQAIASDIVVVAATKKIALSDVAAGLYAHVGLRLAGDTVQAGAAICPPSDAGRWSHRNAFGWDRKRTDWPMVSKSYCIETPNFGDAARNGTHMRIWQREVYQHQVFEPQGMQIETEVLGLACNDHVVVKFALSSLLSREQSEFELMLLWALNVLQENTGVMGVFASDASRDEYARTIQLDWEIFPPGSIAEVIERLNHKPTDAAIAPDVAKLVRDRIAVFERLKPTAYLRGHGSFGFYFGAQFADDLVVFENLKYGNALYVLYEDWTTVSRRSRLELLRDNDARFDRVIHSCGWERRFTELMRQKLRSRQGRLGDI